MLRQTCLILLAAVFLLPLDAMAQTVARDPWWKHAAIYEIYPRSFQDSDGDGIGDLNGITQRMGYLNQLGIDSIWIAPMYPSPQVDFGYDISDYEAIDHQYGTLADFNKLIAAANKHHIHVIVDFVPNHTSNKHKWFLESASSRDNAKADWYVWNDGVPADGPKVSDYQKRWVRQSKDGPVVPPNNWVSQFGGSAWEWSPTRKQFYYHQFYKQQPDLNWRNPAVVKAMMDEMRFWLDRGVAGFRLDAVTTLFEDPQLRDEPAKRPGLNEQGDPILTGDYTNNLPEVHEIMREMRAVVDSYPGGRVLIGETWVPNTAALRKWYGDAKLDELQLPMDFLLGFNNKQDYKLDAAKLRTFLSQAEAMPGDAQPLFVFDNHDHSRSYDRFGDGVHDPQIARILSTLLYTTRATAMTYYGAELGMTTERPKRVEDVRDPIGITGWPKQKGRDGERTPMQWTSGPQAGFSSNPHTWLPIEPNYKMANVETELADPNSLLNWNRTLIAIRAQNPVMHTGKMVLLDTSNPSVLSYARKLGKQVIVVAMNMTTQPQTIHLDLTAAGIASTQTKTLLSDDALTQATTVSTATLAPFATLIAEVVP